ncbi:MAG: hypothetical protein MR400_01815 [Clostridiales bacterium]|nr:hypothetical protein [Clostridiales bacterium]
MPFLSFHAEYPALRRPSVRFAWPAPKHGALIAAQRMRPPAAPPEKPPRGFPCFFMIPQIHRKNNPAPGARTGKSGVFIIIIFGCFLSFFTDLQNRAKML